MDFCDCKDGAAARPVIAMAAVPAQKWETLYDWKTALETGTVFPSLDLPFFAMEKKGGMGNG